MDFIVLFNLSPCMRKVQSAAMILGLGGAWPSWSGRWFCDENRVYNLPSLFIVGGGSDRAKEMA